VTTRRNKKYSSNSILALVVFLAAGGSAHTQIREPAAKAAEFSGSKAMEQVSRMVAIGPRTAGSPEGKLCGDYIQRELQALGLKTFEDKFVADTPVGAREMRNIVALIPGKREEFIILSSHYDTKLYKEFRFVGGNDGGSSSGVLLEMARVLSLQPKGEFTKWITFFDGEEAFIEWTDDDSLYGSRNLVRMLDRSGRLARLRAMILVDMVGAKTLRLKRETSSTPWLVDLIWKKAGEMGYSRIFVSDSFSAMDDHLPFLKVGIPAVDLLDLEYPFWHRAADSLDKLDAGNMEITGRAVLHSLPLIETRLASSPHN
jgi:glutaminyl-peptide cyclotransferase